MEYAPSSLAFVVHRLSVSHLPQKPSRLGSEARVTIVDVRDEERGYDSHIVKSNKRCAGASNWTVKDIVESVRNEFGSIDILVHSLANGPEDLLFLACSHLDNRTTMTRVSRMDFGDFDI
ncbi:Enoyl-[acyl-carrier-protein] reductase [NADH] chloroplastic [Zea mays]|uniref:Enoyl-[acyl-carrier-protein] reductase [NADH] chloroplastic n=1 Tax=Zea mays TaxID=4577 RepID=A0A1D6KBL4_MAIZE|nr:Enoyl-[acyl-carrier-protein] reductase [NADH] chloroplastic [Zea mays]